MDIYHYLMVLMLQSFLLLHADGQNNLVSVIRNSTFSCAEAKPQLRKIEMTNSDKLALLESKGGHYLPSYMAVDRQEAEDNFINLLQNSVEENGQFWKKSSVLKHLVKIKENLAISKNGTRGNPKLSTRGIKSRRGSHSKIASAANADGFPYVSSADGREDFCIERGSTAPFGGNYKQMCTVCATESVEDLTNSRFPPIFNEAICKPEDLGCFYEENIPHGGCQQMGVHVDILQRRPNFCSLALANDEVVIVDEWELQHYRIRTGCECAIDVNSRFAGFV